MRGPARRVEERKRKLDGRTLVYPCIGLERAEGFAILRYRSERAVAVAGGALRLPAGTETYAVFWAERPFNVYCWCDPAGRTIAYYANAATETRFPPGAVEWLDLEADVLITADLRARVLDLDEVPADLSPDHRRELEAALARLTGDPAALAAEVEALTAPHRHPAPPGR